MERVVSAAAGNEFCCAAGNGKSDFQNSARPKTFWARGFSETRIPKTLLQEIVCCRLACSKVIFYTNPFRFEIKSILKRKGCVGRLRGLLQETRFFKFPNSGFRKTAAAKNFSARGFSKTRIREFGISKKSSFLQASSRFKPPSTLRVPFHPIQVEVRPNDQTLSSRCFLHV
jgi:hypothetical protein